MSTSAECISGDSPTNKPFVINQHHRLKIPLWHHWRHLASYPYWPVPTRCDSVAPGQGVLPDCTHHRMYCIPQTLFSPGSPCKNCCFFFCLVFVLLGRFNECDQLYLVSCENEYNSTVHNHWSELKQYIDEGRFTAVHTRRFFKFATISNYSE